MTDLFVSFLKASLQGSIVICIILLLRLALKKAPRSALCLLWLLAGLRLLLPFELESRLSLQPTVPVTVQQVQAAVDAVQDITTPQEIPAETIWPVEEHEVQTEPYEAPTRITWTQIGAAVWLVGLAAMALYSLLSFLRLKKRVSGALQAEDGVWETDRIGTAFLLGFFRPRIYLPIGLTGDTRALVIAHERAHLARRDHWWKLLGFVVLSVHWFNPVVWLGYALACRDMEMACDERVVRHMDVEQRKAYSAALLRCSAKRGSLSACPVAFAEAGVKDRILRVLNYRKPGFWVSLLAIIAVVFVVVCFLTSPYRNDPMEWARNLSAGDVAYIEFVTPGAEDRQYRYYEGAELEPLVALINGSNGYHISDSLNHNVNGEVTHLYVTMKDGTTHELANHGNTLLSIDGDYFRADQDWLGSWPPPGSGNAPLPEDFAPGLSDQEKEELLRKCLDTLKSWQSLDSYQVFVDNQFSGDAALHDSSQIEYQKSGEDWIYYAYINTMDMEQKIWYLMKDGTQYQRRYGNAPNNWGESETGWLTEDFLAPNEPQEHCLPWVMWLDLDTHTFLFQGYKSGTEEEIISVMMVDHSSTDYPEEMAALLEFHFDPDGSLNCIVWNGTDVYEAGGPDGSRIEHLYYTKTFRLISTDAEEIAAIIDSYYRQATEG